MESAEVQQHQMKDLVDFLARALVDAPAAVETSESESGDEVTVKLKVAREDLGKVIGKQGRTARAMRTILNAAARKANRRALIDIIEE